MPSGSGWPQRVSGRAIQRSSSGSITRPRSASAAVMDPITVRLMRSVHGHCSWPSTRRADAGWASRSRCSQR
eukprot:15248671-Alexandrium_andersonii.AAC.1